MNYLKFKAELAEHWEGYVDEDYVEVTIRETFKSIEDTCRGNEFTLSIEENLCVFLII